MKKLLLLLIVLIATSCENKELCYNHPHHTPVRVDVDWSMFEPYEKPTGMTVSFFSKTSSNTFTRHTNTTTHAIVELPVDSFLVLAFNQSPTEFGAFRFTDMDNKELAAARIVENISRWYVARGNNEVVALEPEWLGVGNCSNIEVTQKMLDDYIESILVGSVLLGSKLEPITTVTPRNVIHTLSVDIHIEGYHNLRSARASLTGMSEGYLLTHGKRMNSTVTHLFEDWDATRDHNDATKGLIHSDITCFGLPDNHSKQPDDNRFILEALLVDNKTIVTFEFAVGDMFIQQEYVSKDNDQHLHLKLILTHDINGNPVVLPDVEPEGGSSSGFDATVEGWGEDIEHNIVM